MATEEQKDRVRAGWGLAASVQDQMARTFYANLFRIDPNARSLFRGDMKLQGRKLASTLGFIVDHLDNSAVLIPAARDLAVRHVSYGVEADQYDAVGAALLQTLQELLGPLFQNEDLEAWAAVYGELTSEMLKAVDEAA